MKSHNALCAAILPALLALHATGQNVTTQAPKPFVIEAGETSIQNLIDATANYLGCNIMAAASEIGQAAPVRLQQAISTDREGCQELLAGMLSRSHLVLTVLDEKLGVMEVINLQGQRGREVFQRAQWKTVDAILKRPRLKMPVTTVVSLKHINAQLANNALRPFFASAGGNGGFSLMIGNAGSQASLIVAGMQDQVAQAIQLIHQCDVEQPPEAFRGPDLPGYVAKLEKRIAALEKRIAALKKKSGTR